MSFLLFAGVVILLGWALEFTIAAYLDARQEAEERRGRG